MASEEMSPGVRQLHDAVAAMRSGKVDRDVLAVIVTAAQEYLALLKSMRQEWGFEAPAQKSLMYTTQNDMLAETMAAGAPKGTVLYTRAAPAWKPVQVTS